MGFFSYHSKFNFRKMKVVIWIIAKLAFKACVTLRVEDFKHITYSVCLVSNRAKNID